MMLSKIDLGNGLGRWNTMPMRRRISVTSMSEDILAVERDLAFNPRVAQRFVDAVQVAQKRGLAAARGSDQRRDSVGREFERDVVQRLKFPVKEIDVGGAHLWPSLVCVEPDVSGVVEVIGVSCCLTAICGELILVDRVI